MSLLAVFIFSLFLCIYVHEDDPCNKNEALKYTGIRGTNCPVSSVKGNSLCDRNLKDVWYRADIDGEHFKIATACPDVAACGTTFPIWINGGHPGVNEGIVNRTACVRGLRQNECCIKTYRIQIKNCGNHYVYKLKYVDVCDEAYCFGNKTCTAPTTTVATTDTNVPDPCINYKSLHNTEKRGTSCSLLMSNSSICDRVLSPKWYRASILGRSLNMPTSCVDVASCSTTFPIWMKGIAPRPEDGIVKRTACVRGLRSWDCCNKEYDVYVKNCGGYNVYHLPYTKSCDEAYCFGSQSCIRVPTTTTTSSNGVEAVKSGVSTLELTVICTTIALLVSFTSLAIVLYHVYRKRSKVAEVLPVERGKQDKTTIIYGISAVTGSEKKF